MRTSGQHTWLPLLPVVPKGRHRANPGESAISALLCSIPSPLARPSQHHSGPSGSQREPPALPPFMRGLGLLRAAQAAAQAAQGPAALGWPAGLPPALQLTSLLGFRMQQAAGFARHRGDDEEEDEELAEAEAHHRRHRHSRLSHSQRVALAMHKLQAAEEQQERDAEEALRAMEEELLEELRERTPVTYERRQQIRRLLRSMGRDGSDAASSFVTRRAAPRAAGRLRVLDMAAAVRASRAVAACMALRLR